MSALLIGAAAILTGPALASETDVPAILERFVADYHDDVMAQNGTFGIRVDGEWWHVVTTGVTEGGTPESVTLGEGPPPEPTFFFYLDAATLDRLDRGTMNAGTAMVKAFSTDVSPMDADVMEGFQPDEAFLAQLLRATFHFWVRGVPEIVPFGEDYTRHTHGADGVIFYYQPGLRSGWFSIKKGQHVNEDPRMQTNEFPTLLVVTEGAGVGKIGGREVELRAGETLFVPPGVTHEFWNTNEGPMRGVLIMFGEGA
jgi:mannose-6-phosphate isomerase-like protein (cupin superfamily)